MRANQRLVVLGLAFCIAGCAGAASRPSGGTSHPAPVPCDSGTAECVLRATWVMNLTPSAYRAAVDDLLVMRTARELWAVDAASGTTVYREPAAVDAVTRLAAVVVDGHERLWTELVDEGQARVEVRDVGQNLVVYRRDPPPQDEGPDFVVAESHAAVVMNDEWLELLGATAGSVDAVDAVWMGGLEAAEILSSDPIVVSHRHGLIGFELVPRRQVEALESVDVNLRFETTRECRGIAVETVTIDGESHPAEDGFRAMMQVGHGLLVASFQSSSWRGCLAPPLVLPVRDGRAHATVTISVADRP